MEEEFYDIFLQKKKENKGDKDWTWPVIGGFVDKEQGTIRLAFKNKSLTRLERDVLTEKYLSNKLPSDSNDKKSDLSDYEPSEILIHIISNLEVFKKEPLTEKLIMFFDASNIRKEYQELKETVQSMKKEGN